MIHIASIDISAISRSEYRQLYAQASPDRKERADRCLRAEDRIRCVAADALVRRALKKTLSLTEFTVEQGPYGKPRIREAPDFHYNLSHSGRWVVMAWGANPLGIDVEQIRIDTAKAAVARRHFTADEQEYVFDAAGNCLADRFFQIWTGKESYLKYLGTGLCRPLKSFSVLADGDHPEVRFFFTRLDDCCLTLCAQDISHTMELLTPGQLIQNHIERKEEIG